MPLLSCLPGSKTRKIPYPTKNPFTWLFLLVSCPNYTYEVRVCPALLSSPSRGWGPTHMEGPAPNRGAWLRNCFSHLEHMETEKLAFLGVGAWLRQL